MQLPTFNYKNEAAANTYFKVKYFYKKLVTQEAMMMPVPGDASLKKGTLLPCHS